MELGEQLKIKIPYSGTGPFDVKLRKDNHDVPESDRVKMTPFDDYMILIIKGNSLFTQILFISNHCLSDHLSALPMARNNVS